jgi:hypothetical protein
MDFIERLFDMAPDGGNGLLEMSLLLFAGVAIAVRLGVATFRRRSIYRRNGVHLSLSGCREAVSIKMSNRL